MKAMDFEDFWQAVRNRDASFDGTFVYAVRSTGVYCLPSCPSRKPHRDRVSFFRLPEAAEQAGFRPCMRCRPDRPERNDPCARMVRAACRHIREEDPATPLTASVLAERLSISVSHLRRSFRRLMGITPAQYARACRLARAKALFRERGGITDALYEAGYGSSSRLYEKASLRLGMTPGVYARGGKGMNIGYTIVDSPLGRLLVAATDKGVSAVSAGDSDESLRTALLEEFPAAQIHRDDDGLRDWVRALLDHLEGWTPRLDLPLDLQVTAFQWKVYEMLRGIPCGETRTYEEIAVALGCPKSVRAVAGACARNPAAIIVPCHRVVRKDGGLAGYRWGIERKRRLLDAERRGIPGSGETPGKDE